MITLDSLGGPGTITRLLEREEEADVRMEERGWREAGKEPKTGECRGPASRSQERQGGRFPHSLQKESV